MFVLYPHERFSSIARLDPSSLISRGICAVVLDVDNTLATHDNPVPAPGTLEWLASARRVGLRLIILSNNHASRVAPFAQQLGIPFEADGKKPLPSGILRACAHLCALPGQTAVVGDQLFTDVLGGRLAGCHTVLVDPIEAEKSWFFRLKRRLERPVLHCYEKRRRRLS